MWEETITEQELQTWWERVATDPKAFDELVTLIGENPKSEKLEDVYWGHISYKFDIEIKAKHILKRLISNPSDKLLKILPDDLMSMKNKFRKEAAQRRHNSHLSDSEWKNIKHHPVLLPETVLEGQDYFYLAAAMYAVEHDTIDVNFELQIFTQVMLRFKLAHVLHLLDSSQESASFHMDIALSALELLKQIDRLDQIPKTSKDQLRYYLYEWLGGRYSKLKKYEQASYAHKEAARYASQLDRSTENIELQVECIILAASDMAEAGDIQAGFRLLQDHQGELQRVVSPDIHELWNTNFSWLKHQLGGLSETQTDQDEITQKIINVANGWLVHEQAPDQESLEGMQAYFRQARNSLKPDDVDGNLRLVLAMLRVIDPQVDLNQWQSLMAEAEALEPSANSNKLKLDLQFLSARFHVINNPELASQQFKQIWDEFQQTMSIAEQLPFAGFYLESLSSSFIANDFSIVCNLVETIQTLISRLLSQQPTSSARKRIRETHQRTIEGAIGTLLVLTEHESLDGRQHQYCFYLAWQTFLLTRNIELNTRIPSTYDDRHKELLTGFESSYRSSLISIDIGEGSKTWKTKLTHLLDYELSHKNESTDFMLDKITLPEDGLAIGLFQFRESSQEIAAMVHYQGRYSAFLIENIENHITALNAWRTFLSSNTMHLLPNLLKEELSDIANIYFHTYLENIADEAPWYLYVESGFNEFPLEMLPSKARLGNINDNHALQYVLRQERRNSAINKIDFSRGWLATADVPAVGGFSALSGTRKEVGNINQLLIKQGFRTFTLYHEDATISNLQSQFSRLKPAVLHLAVHGIANREYPEACALVLAEDAGQASGEFMLFRQIQSLDCKDVQLVVLSACSSSIGKTSRSSGLEGLVWSFLQAGAQQVVASRYSVSDQATARFMTVFYDYLQQYNVTIALQKTRTKCLDESMSVREVAAWGCWS